MQDEHDTKPTGKTRQKLFPDLAPYGELKPLPKAAPEKEQVVEKPRVFTSHPTIAERPLSALFDTTPPSIVPVTEVIVKAETNEHEHHTNSRLVLKMGLGAMLFIGLTFGSWFYFYHSTNPVPINIAKLVSFPIYYPDQKKLPTGYTLDRDSFHSPIKDGIGYTVSYDDNKKIVFSVQSAPSDTEVQAFNNSYIPTHTEYQTPLGQAGIGLFKKQLLVSLPIKNDSWVVITAQPDIDRDKLKTVIQSLRN